MEVGFSKIHVFPYSKREGTKAATMPLQIPNNIKKERARRLIAIDEDLQLEFNKRFVGQVVKVLIEENKDGMAIGHTENFLKVIIKENLKENTFYDVVIESALIDKVFGNLR